MTFASGSHHFARAQLQPLPSREVCCEDETAFNVNSFDCEIVGGQHDAIVSGSPADARSYVAYSLPPTVKGVQNSKLCSGAVELACRELKERHA